MKLIRCGLAARSFSETLSPNLDRTAKVKAIPHSPRQLKSNPFIFHVVLLPAPQNPLISPRTFAISIITGQFYPRASGSHNNPHNLQFGSAAEKSWKLGVIFLLKFFL